MRRGSECFGAPAGTGRTGFPPRSPGPVADPWPPRSLRAWHHAAGLFSGRNSRQSRHQVVGGLPRNVGHAVLSGDRLVGLREKFQVPKGEFWDKTGYFSEFKVWGHETSVQSVLAGH